MTKIDCRCGCEGERPTTKKMCISCWMKQKEKAYREKNKGKIPASKRNEFYQEYYNLIEKRDIFT